MPAIGSSESHVTMGTGAWLSSQLIPPQIRNIQGNTIPGPQAILVRIRKGVSPTVALRSLQQINTTINKEDSDSPAGGVTGVLRPAEIVNYRSMGTTPALLGAALAVGATTALTLTLIASVRRRRRELALLKTLGYARRQLAAVVAWHSSIAVGIGVIVGVPAGIIVGRSLWDLFARAIHVIPDPTVPALTIALIAVGALILANLVAAIPGLQAAHTRTALLLHAE
jgi:ABC-type antimicrobial peptide transport system permease subunit